MSRIDLMDEREERLRYVPTDAGLQKKYPGMRVKHEFGTANIRTEHHPIIEDITSDRKELSHIIVIDGKSRTNCECTI